MAEDWGAETDAGWGEEDAGWGDESGGILKAPEPTIDVPEIKLFGKWTLDDVMLSDMSLQVSFY